MRPASQLIEQGIKAYTRGQLEDAERLWREALALEPMNDRARAYLDLLQGAPAPQPVPPVPAAAPLLQPVAPEEPDAPPQAAVAAPAASRAPNAVAPPSGNGPVPLPPPEVPEPPARITLTDYAPSPWDLGPAESSSIVLDGEGGLDLRTLDEKSDLRSLVPDQGQPSPTPPPTRPARASKPAKPVSDVEVWMQGAKELHALGDFSGSLEMIEKILKVDPAHAEARAYLKQNEATLIAMYESKLGTMSSIPRLAIKPEEVLWLNLDHRAGFLLAQIDGSVNFEDLFALSGLPRLDTARIISQLLQEGVITA